jgi:NMD protein affecting ribosome stability and mRNA decay
MKCKHCGEAIRPTNAWYRNEYEHSQTGGSWCLGKLTWAWPVKEQE